MSQRLADEVTRTQPFISCVTQRPVPANNPASLGYFSSGTATFGYDSSPSRQPASHSRRAYHLSASLDISTGIHHNPTFLPNLLTPRKTLLHPRLRAKQLLPSCKLKQAASLSGFHLKSDGKFSFSMILHLYFFLSVEPYKISSWAPTTRPIAIEHHVSSRGSVRTNPLMVIRSFGAQRGDFRNSR
jgi:hypothetical protein